VQIARNQSAHHFLASDCEHLMFIDADTEFKGADVLQLLVLQIDNPEFDIIGSAARVKKLAATSAFAHLETMAAYSSLRAMYPSRWRPSARPS
jgi:hypothetical protein